MKKLVHFLVTVCVLAGLGFTLWIGLRKQEQKSAGHEPKAREDAAATEEKAEDFVVTIEREKRERLGLEKATPEKTELAPRRVAFGRVLDPTPLVALDGELAAAEAVLAASRAENDRTQKLLAAGENTSRRIAEGAQAQFRADEIKVESLRRKALLDWGEDLANLDATKRRALAEQLINGAVAIVRVDILPGDALTEPPRSARLLVLGRETQPIETNEIAPAFDADPKTQAQGFLLRVEKPPFALRPGMALTAWLELAEKPRSGFAIPRSAVLRHDGRAWVFVQEDEEKFVRKPVTLDTPLDGEKGWFVVEGGGIDEGDGLVVTGAQMLLSEELKAQGGAEVD